MNVISSCAAQGSRFVWSPEEGEGRVQFVALQVGATLPSSAVTPSLSMSSKPFSVTSALRVTACPVTGNACVTRRANVGVARDGVTGNAGRAAAQRGAVLTLRDP